MTMIDSIWDILIETAKKKEVITYTELCKKLSLEDYKVTPRFLAPHLTKVGNMCHERNMPILAALVVRESNKIPGPGYFNFQGKIRDKSKTPMETWREEINLLWNKWDGNH